MVQRMLSTHTKILMAKGLSHAIRLGRRLAGWNHCTAIVRDGLRWRVDLCEGIDLAINRGIFEADSISVQGGIVGERPTRINLIGSFSVHTIGGVKTAD
jgi:hypothetical protein